MRGERTAKDLRADMRIGGAARMGEQTGVIGLHRGRAVDAEPVTDQRRVQPVLERKAHPEVGGQAQRRHQLRGSNLLADLRRLG
jgi:hypothetical protein